MLHSTITNIELHVYCNSQRYVYLMRVVMYVCTSCVWWCMCVPHVHVCVMNANLLCVSFNKIVMHIQFMAGWRSCCPVLVSSNIDMIMSFGIIDLTLIGSISEHLVFWRATLTVSYAPAAAACPLAVMYDSDHSESKSCSFLVVIGVSMLLLLSTHNFLWQEVVWLSLVLSCGHAVAPFCQQLATVTGFVYKGRGDSTVCIRHLFCSQGYLSEGEPASVNLDAVTDSSYSPSKYNLQWNGRYVSDICQ